MFAQLRPRLDALEARTLPSAPQGRVFVGLERESVGGIVGTFHNDLIGLSPSDYTAVIRWGDGTGLDTGEMGDLGGETFKISGSHTYKQEGTYAISVRVILPGGTEWAEGTDHHSEVIAGLAHIETGLKNASFQVIDTPTITGGGTITESGTPLTNSGTHPTNWEVDAEGTVYYRLTTSGREGLYQSFTRMESASVVFSIVQDVSDYVGHFDMATNSVTAAGTFTESMTLIEKDMAGSFSRTEGETGSYAYYKTGEEAEYGEYSWIGVSDAVVAATVSAAYGDTSYSLTESAGMTTGFQGADSSFFNVIERTVQITGTYTTTEGGARGPTTYTGSRAGYRSRIEEETMTWSTSDYSLHVSDHMSQSGTETGSDSAGTYTATIDVESTDENIDVTGNEVAATIALGGTEIEGDTKEWTWVRGPDTLTETAGHGSENSVNLQGDEAGGDYSQTVSSAQVVSEESISEINQTDHSSLTHAVVSYPLELQTGNIATGEYTLNSTQTSTETTNSYEENQSITVTSGDTVQSSATESQGGNTQSGDYSVSSTFAETMTASSTNDNHDRDDTTGERGVRNGSSYESGNVLSGGVSGSETTTGQSTATLTETNQSFTLNSTDVVTSTDLVADAGNTHTGLSTTSTTATSSHTLTSQSDDQTDEVLATTIGSASETSVDTINDVTGQETVTATATSSDSTRSTETNQSLTVLSTDYSVATETTAESGDNVLESYSTTATVTTTETVWSVSTDRTNQVSATTIGSSNETSVDLQNDLAGGEVVSDTLTSTESTTSQDVNQSLTVFSTDFSVAVDTEYDSNNVVTGSFTTSVTETASHTLTSATTDQLDHISVTSIGSSSAVSLDQGCEGTGRDVSSATVASTESTTSQDTNQSLTVTSTDVVTSTDIMSDSGDDVDMNFTTSATHTDSHTVWTATVDQLMNASVTVTGSNSVVSVEQGNDENTGYATVSTTATGSETVTSLETNQSLTITSTDTTSSTDISRGVGNDITGSFTTYATHTASHTLTSSEDNQTDHLSVTVTGSESCVSQDIEEDWLGDDSGTQTVLSTESVVSREVNQSETATSTEVYSSSDTVTESGNQILGDYGTTRHSQDSYSFSADSTMGTAQTHSSMVVNESVYATDDGNAILGTATAGWTRTATESVSGTGHDARGDFSFTATTTTTTTETRSANDMTGAYTVSTQASSSGVRQQNGSTGAKAYVQTINSASGATVSETGNNILGSFTQTGTEGSSVTEVELGPSSNTNYSLTVTEVSTGSNSIVGNHDTGGYTEHATEAINSTVNEIGTSLTGSFTLTKTESSLRSIVQTGNEVVGTYGSSGTWADSATTTESMTYGSDASSFVETDRQNGSISETANSTTGSYTEYQTLTVVTTFSQSYKSGATNVTVNESGTETVNKSESGNRETGAYTNSESNSMSYSSSEWGVVGGSTFVMSESDNGHYTKSGSGNTTTGSYTVTKTGSDSFSIFETTTATVGGTAKYYNQLRNGNESFTQTDSGNSADDSFQRTTSVSGSYTTTETIGTVGTTTSSVSTSSTGDTYLQTETNNPRAGILQMTESGSNRYTNLRAFVDVANAKTGKPGHVNFYAYGTPFLDPSPSAGGVSATGNRNAFDFGQWVDSLKRGSSNNTDSGSGSAVLPADASGGASGSFGNAGPVAVATGANQTVTHLSDGGAEITTRNANGQVVCDAIVASDGTVTQTTTSEYSGSVLTATDQTDKYGKLTRTTYDAQGHILTVTTTDPAIESLSTITYVWQGDRLVSMTDPAGNTTSYSYDETGQVVTTTDAFGHSDVKQYDSAGNLVSETDRNGIRRDMTYNAAGQILTEIWYNPGGESLTQARAFTYDDAGRLLTATSAAGTYVFSYNDAGQVTSAVEPSGITLTFGYDDSGNRTLVEDSIGDKEVSVYDGKNLVKRQLWQGDALLMEVDQAFDDHGHVLTRTELSEIDGSLSPVATTNYTYDASGKAIEIQHLAADGSPLADYQYRWDDAGWSPGTATGGSGVSLPLAVPRLLGTVEDGVPTNNYSYDASGQLVGDGTNTFAYDANGNPIAAGWVIGADNRLLSDATWTYSYDNEGNLTGKVKADGESWGYGWDPRKELIHVEHHDAAGDLVLTADYEYDALGNRTMASIDPDGAGPNLGTITRFALDGFNSAKGTPIGNENWDVWADLNSDGSLKTHYLHGDAVDELFGRYGAGDGQHWTLTDNQGSVRMVLGYDGTALDRITYNAWGQIVSETHAAARGRYAWTGRELDVETDLQYNRARYYDASLHRWIAQDPMNEQAGDSNLYRYVNNAPTNHDDPSGLYLIITEDQKKLPIEAYFGAGNVTYTPIGDGKFKVTLSKGAIAAIKDYARDLPMQSQDFAAFIIYRAFDPGKGYTLSQVGDDFTAMVENQKKIGTTPEARRLYMLRWRAANPFSGSFLQPSHDKQPGVPMSEMEKKLRKMANDYIVDNFIAEITKQIAIIEEGNKELQRKDLTFDDRMDIARKQLEAATNIGLLTEGIQGKMVKGVKKLAD